MVAGGGGVGEAPAALKPESVPCDGLAVTVYVSDWPAGSEPVRVMALAVLKASLADWALAVGGARLARLKVAGLGTPLAEAVTVYLPAVPLAVAVTDAWPFGPIVAEAAERVAVAPPGAGLAANWIVPPATGDPPSLLATVRPSGRANAAPRAATCGVEPGWG